MSDMILTCINCHSRFVWSAGERRYFAAHGLNQPKRCKDCRSRRRRERDSGNRGFSGPPPPGSRPTTQSGGKSRRPSAFQPRPRHPRPPGDSKPQPTGWWHNPFLRFGIPGAILIMALLMLLVYWITDLTWWGVGLAYLFAINPVTYLLYRFDKWIAGGQQTRVPEILLLALTALGASPAAFLAMFSARHRHKVKKTSFQIKFWAIVAVQVIILCSIPILLGWI